MQSRFQDIQAADGEVLAICVDSVEENAKVVEKLKLDFSVLSDQEMKCIKEYGLLHNDAGTPSGTGDIARPAVYVIDRKGVVRWRHLTDNWRVRVRPETVLEQLAEIP